MENKKITTILIIAGLTALILGVSYFGNFQLGKLKTSVTIPDSCVVENWRLYQVYTTNADVKARFDDLYSKHGDPLTCRGDARTALSSSACAVQFQMDDATLVCWPMERINSAPTDQSQPNQEGDIPLKTPADFPEFGNLLNSSNDANGAPNPDKLFENVSKFFKELNLDGQIDTKAFANKLSEALDKIFKWEDIHIAEDQASSPPPPSKPPEDESKNYDAVSAGLEDYYDTLKANLIIKPDGTPLLWGEFLRLLAVHENATMEENNKAYEQWFRGNDKFKDFKDKNFKANEAISLPIAISIYPDILDNFGVQTITPQDYEGFNPESFEPDAFAVSAENSHQAVSDKYENYFYLLNNPLLAPDGSPATWKDYFPYFNEQRQLHVRDFAAFEDYLKRSFADEIEFTQMPIPHESDPISEGAIDLLFEGKIPDGYYFASGIHMAASGLENGLDSAKSYDLSREETLQGLGDYLGLISDQEDENRLSRQLDNNPDFRDYLTLLMNGQLSQDFEIPITDTQLKELGNALNKKFDDPSLADVITSTFSMFEHGGEQNAATVSEPISPSIPSPIPDRTITPVERDPNTCTQTEIGGRIVIIDDDSECQALAEKQDLEFKARTPTVVKQKKSSRSSKSAKPSSPLR